MHAQRGPSFIQQHSRKHCQGEMGGLTHYSHICGSPLRFLGMLSVRQKRSEASFELGAR